MTTASVIVGKVDAKAIVCTPPPAMLKLIVSAPALAFALMMAWRSEPAPASEVLTTLNVLGNTRTSSDSRPGLKCAILTRFGQEMRYPSSRANRRIQLRNACMNELLIADAERFSLLP